MDGKNKGRKREWMKQRERESRVRKFEWKKVFKKQEMEEAIKTTGM